MYELLTLGRLMYAPEHGYQIAKIASDMIGPWAKISLGTLYPLLTKLEQVGYIRKLEEGQEATPPGGKQRQTRTTYEITPAGQRRFHQLMMDTTSNPGDYQRIFHLKFLYLELLLPGERLLLLEHYRNYCEVLVHYLQSEVRDLFQVASNSTQEHKFSPHFLAASEHLMTHQVEQWQAEMNWVKAMHNQEARRAERGHADNTLNEAGGGMPSQDQI